MTKFKKNTYLSLLYLSICRKYAKCRTKADAHDKIGFQYISISVDIVRSHAQIQRGDRGSGPPPPTPEKSQKYRISWQYWTGSPEILKTTKPAFNVGPSLARLRNAILADLRVFRLRADDGPLLVIFGISLPQKPLSEFGSRSDWNGIQERMFRQFKHLGMR